MGHFKENMGNMGNMGHVKENMGQNMGNMGHFKGNMGQKYGKYGTGGCPANDIKCEDGEEVYLRLTLPRSHIPRQNTRKRHLKQSMVLK